MVAEVDLKGTGCTADLSDDPHVLEGGAVFEALGCFLMALLDALAAHCPERSVDPSVAAYRSLAHRWRTAAVPPG